MKEVRNQKSEIRNQKSHKLLTVCCLLLIAYCLLLTGNSIAEEKALPQGIRRIYLPWKINAPQGFEYIKGAVNDMLASRLGAESSIEIVNESSIKSALSKYSQEEITEEIVKSIGQEIKTDYVIYGSITIIAESISIDAKTIAVNKIDQPIFFSSRSKGLENLISLVDEMAKDSKAKILKGAGSAAVTAGASESSTYTGKFVVKEKPAETPEDDDFIIMEKGHVKGIWKSPQFDSSIKHIDIADIDGDKKNEIIILDSHNLFIYRLRNQKLELIKEFKGNVSVKNYSISTDDINNNGVSEIYVTRIVHDKLDSYVLEYKDNEFKTIASDLRWFLRALREPKMGSILLGQKYSSTNGFFGPVQILKWQNGQLEESSVFDIPKNLNIYNFQIADLGKDGATDIISLDERDYLHIYNKDNDGSWKEIWKSGEYYGGSLNRLELGATSDNEASDFIDIKAKIIHEDLDGDGIGEIIINRNDPGVVGRYLKVIRSYKNSEMVNLSWEGYGLEENWRTRKIDGYIADYIVSDIDNDGQKELVIAVTMDGGIGKSYIMAYKLNPVRSLLR